MYLENPVHITHIDGDAAGWRVHLPFDRRSHAERNDRNTMRGTYAHRILNVRDPLGEYDRIGRLGRQPRGRMGMLIPNRLRGRKAVAEARREVSLRGRQSYVARLRVMRIHRSRVFWSAAACWWAAQMVEGQDSRNRFNTGAQAAASVEVAEWPFSLSISKYSAVTFAALNRAIASAASDGGKIWSVRDKT
jgi:hypothetical protein